MYYILYYLLLFTIYSFLSSSTCLSKTTMLQIGLRLVARSKDVIKNFHDYGECSMFEETRRLKAFNIVNNRKSLVQKLKVEIDLTQVVSDNFNANINTQNCIK